MANSWHHVRAFDNGAFSFGAPQANVQANIRANISTITNNTEANTHVFPPPGNWQVGCRFFSLQGNALANGGVQREIVAPPDTYTWNHTITRSSDANWGNSTSNNFDVDFGVSQTANADLTLINNFGYYREKKYVKWTFSGGIWSTLNTLLNFRPLPKLGPRPKPHKHHSHRNWR